MKKLSNSSFFTRCVVNIIILVAIMERIAIWKEKDYESTKQLPFLVPITHYIWGNTDLLPKSFFAWSYLY